jgi:hypothetical protein
MTPKSVFVAVLVFLPVPALAQTIDVTGVWSYTSELEAHPAGEDLVALHLSSVHDRFEPANTDFPIADASGKCFGAMLIRAGQASGGGNCHIVDADGDMYVSDWIVEGVDAANMTTGRWTLIGGTGKFSGASGGGTFRSGQDASGAYKNEVTGEMTLN